MAEHYQDASVNTTAATTVILEISSWINLFFMFCNKGSINQPNITQFFEYRKLRTHRRACFFLKKKESQMMAAFGRSYLKFRSTRVCDNNCFTFVICSVQHVKVFFMWRQGKCENLHIASSCNLPRNVLSVKTNCWTDNGTGVKYDKEMHLGTNFIGESI